MEFNTPIIRISDVFGLEVDQPAVDFCAMKPEERQKSVEKNYRRLSRKVRKGSLKESDVKVIYDGSVSSPTSTSTSSTLSRPLSRANGGFTSAPPGRSVRERLAWLKERHAWLATPCTRRELVEYDEYEKRVVLPDAESIMKKYNDNKAADMDLVISHWLAELIEKNNHAGTPPVDWLVTINKLSVISNTHKGHTSLNDCPSPGSIHISSLHLGHGACSDNDESSDVIMDKESMVIDSHDHDHTSDCSSQGVSQSFVSIPITLRSVSSRKATPNPTLRKSSSPPAIRKAKASTPTPHCLPSKSKLKPLSVIVVGSKPKKVCVRRDYASLIDTPDFKPLLPDAVKVRWNALLREGRNQQLYDEIELHLHQNRKIVNASFPTGTAGNDRPLLLKYLGRCPLDGCTHLCLRKDMYMSHLCNKLRVDKRICPHCGSVQYGSHDYTNHLIGAHKIRVTK